MGSPENRPSLPKRMLHSTTAGVCLFFAGGALELTAVSDGIALGHEQTEYSKAVNHPIAGSTIVTEIPRRPNRNRAILDGTQLFLGLAMALKGGKTVIRRIDESIEKEKEKLTT